MDTSTLEKHKEYTRNEYNNPYFSFVLETLKENNIKTMIDAGACTGEVTKIMFENTTLEKAYIIEALQSNIGYIQENLQDHNIELHYNALIYGKDKVTFGRLPQNVGGGSVFLPGEVEVTAITLEQLPIVDFLKLDIEGLEGNIIENSINIKKIKYLDIEFHHYDELLSQKENRAEFLKKHLPHKIIKESYSNIFLSL